MFHAVLLWLCLWRLDGVCGDAVKSVSVMEGESVTLNTGVTEIQTRDLILWTFGLQKTRIAEIDKDSGFFSAYDVPDGRFRDRLKLDHQSGSLTITNTRTTDSGLYIVIIRGTNPTTYRFSVHVNAATTSDPLASSHSPSGLSTDSQSSVIVSVIVLISVVVGSLLIVAVTGLCCIYRKYRDHEDKTDPTLYKLTGHMTESEMTEVIYTCFTPEQ